MEKKKVVFRGMWLVVLLAAMCFWVTSAQAELQYGKAYDKSNYQEIEDLLAHGENILIKNGDMIMQVEELKHDIKREPAFLEKSQENEGKYDVDAVGNLIHKGSGEPVDWYYGYPFPNIDPKDPNVCFHIMHNFQSTKSSMAGKTEGMNKVDFVGDRGSDKQIWAYLDQLYYQNRPDGQIPNPNGFTQQSMQIVHAPYDVRGIISMSWVYIDARQDSAWSYLPMLRRVRRVSAASRSDPFFGGDSGTDDAYGYYGKIAALEYKYLGERSVLVPMTNLEMTVLKREPDGSVIRPKFEKQLAYEVPQSQQANFVWEGLSWIPLPVYLVEAYAKDPYYNYGKQIFHISKDIYSMPYKDVYDKAGEYWKCNFVVDSCWVTEDGVKIGNNADISWMIDLRSRHSTPAIQWPTPGFNARFLVPYKEMNEGRFTASEMMQISK